MALATAASAIGKQVVTYAVRTWLGARRERGQRGSELIELVRIGVPDHFQQRKLVRQLEDLADEIAERLRPLAWTSFTRSFPPRAATTSMRR